MIITTTKHQTPEFGDIRKIIKFPIFWPIHLDNTSIIFEHVIVTQKYNTNYQWRTIKLETLESFAFVEGELRNHPRTGQVQCWTGLKWENIHKFMP